ncbi:GIN domain-containing protein [Flavobacterium limnophilum]|uniref:GIN domain-containing protein n=1 Tax=Flavobacterium limnophilum TaxID=3003262 RepID=UPI0022AC57C2|nr:DUF2807 domain-containing protein [Flavobacterium limnophilum]
MKKHAALLLFFLVSTLALAQKSEKIKGSKTVTIEQKEIGSFDSLEVSDNIEVFLDKGEKCELKIEADDNLHDIITIDLNAKTLRINTPKEASNYKKLVVRITYTKELKMITANNDAVINAIQEIQLDEITLKTHDNAKLFLNVSSKDFVLQSDDNSKTELNLKAENATIELSKNTTLKALISCLDLKCDLYQKAKATLEGDVSNANIRLDNNAIFNASKLVIKNANLLAENYSSCDINVNTLFSLDASGNSEIHLYGDQKIETKRFMDNASLIKKPTK